jgi:hypothetical protein
MFARDMRWGNNYLSDMTQGDNRCQLLQLALYAQQLGTSNTIFCRSIKVASTVKAYTNAAASLMALFGKHPRDVWKEVPTNAHVSRVLSTVYNKLHWWETVPNRREPFPPQMLKDVQQRATNPADGWQPDSCCWHWPIGSSAPCFQVFACPNGRKTPPFCARQLPARHAPRRQSPVFGRRLVRGCKPRPRFIRRGINAQPPSPVDEVLDQVLNTE